jgi:uncharacterized damage-inducible protein DinB
MSSPSPVIASPMSSALIAEMEQEAATTRKCLERIPADKFDFKPHEKSFSMRSLAVHIAEMFAWTMPTVAQDALDFAAMDYKPAEPDDTAELVSLLDKNVAAAIEAIRSMPDEKWHESWSLKNGETTYFTMPKIAVMRSMVMNHIIHHRGQLSVYLRLCDIPVPALYGPSADEGQM